MVNEQQPWGLPPTPSVQSHLTCDGPLLAPRQQLPSDGFPWGGGEQNSTATVHEHWTAQKTDRNN